MKIAIFQWNVLITIFSELNLNWLIHFFLIYLMPPTFQILYGDFNKFPGFKLWIKFLNVTYQMKSLQWQQNVGCLKNLGMNLWSLTSDIFFFFRAPFLARNLWNENYVYFPFSNYWSCLDVSTISSPDTAALSWSVFWVMLGLPCVSLK